MNAWKNKWKTGAVQAPAAVTPYKEMTMERYALDNKNPLSDRNPFSSEDRLRKISVRLPESILQDLEELEEYDNRSEALREGARRIVEEVERDEG
ncbi:MAG: CopG family ribbon-helix-helix protein [Candidatus Aenigmatarchaeota archaeon]